MTPKARWIGWHRRRGKKVATKWKSVWDFSSFFLISLSLFLIFSSPLSLSTSHYCDPPPSVAGRVYMPAVGDQPLALP